MADEQLYGKEGIEADQGFFPMPEAPPEKSEEVEVGEALQKWSDRIEQEAKPIVDRSYIRTDGDDIGKPYPEAATVSPERAARDLAENREAEAAVAELDRNAQLAAEIDAARGFGRGESLRAQQEEAQQPGAEQPAPEVMQTEPWQPQATPTDGIEPEVAAALKNPKVLTAIQTERVADLMRVEAAINQTTQWAQEGAALALAAVFTRPELQGIPPQQLPGALQAIAKTNPALHTEIQGQVQRAGAAVQQAQQALQQQQQRHAVAFQGWAKSNDDAFDRAVASESPETVVALKQTVHQMLNEGGLSDQQILHEWNSNPVMRSALGQQIMADAARWRMAKAGIKPAPKPVPQVARPGSSMDRPAAADRDSFALEQRYSGSLSVKDAAKLTIARRARAR